MFFARNVRVPGIPTLSREEVNCKELAEKRMKARETTRQRRNRGHKSAVRSFEIGERVRYFDEKAKHWKNIGQVSNILNHRSLRIQLYYIINDRGEEILRPRMHVAEL